MIVLLVLEMQPASGRLQNNNNIVGGVESSAAGKEWDF